MIRLLILAVLAASTSTAAFGFQSKPVLGENRDWRVLGVSGSGETAEFIDANSIVRTGQTVEFDVLAVYRQARRQLASNPNYDNELREITVDCGSKTSQIRSHYARLGDHEAPPTIIVVDVRNPGIPPPAPGTAADIELRTACEEVPLAAARIEDPYAWARSRLQTP